MCCGELLTSCEGNCHFMGELPRWGTVALWGSCHVVGDYCQVVGGLVTGFIGTVFAVCSG